jgi:hypothetical protein
VYNTIEVIAAFKKLKTIVSLIPSRCIDFIQVLDIVLNQLMWWGEMSLLLEKSLNLSNSSPILRALMYVASLQTFGLSSSSLRRR